MPMASERSNPRDRTSNGSRMRPQGKLKGGAGAKGVCEKAALARRPFLQGAGSTTAGGRSRASSER